jgi:hypothetical protein
MKKDITAIITLLATQSMIHLGEIPDPLTKETSISLDRAQIFIDLLSILKKKTEGNLSRDEQDFFDDVLTNLNQVFQKKSSKRN